MQRDSIDFRTMKVGKLFRKQLFPTILGMVFSALFVIIDGIFVGRGIGSDALAAVNIAAPLFVIATGIGLMFGMGGAIVASINLAKGKERVANINATQSVVMSAIVIVCLSLFIVCFPEWTARLLGAPDDILQLACEYLTTFALFATFQTMLSLLTFFVRIDGPKVAMYSMIIATIINIVLDYIFIFPLQWGLIGAAVATGIGEVVGCGILFVYLLRYSPRIRLGRLKLSNKSIRLTLRNTGYIVRLGFSAFLCEIAIAVMMLTGNYVFARYLGTDGVAAYSIVCYFFPIIFMVFNAIIQSAQPIISFNHGCGEDGRAKRALRLALYVTLGFGLVFWFGSNFLNDFMVTLFIKDAAHPAWGIATYGIPIFALCYVWFGINVMSIGYFMSVEKVLPATVFTIMRGIVLPVICFFLLPLYLGIDGIWLAVPVAELATSIAIGIYLLAQRRRLHGKIYQLNT